MSFIISFAFLFFELFYSLQWFLWDLFCHGITVVTAWPGFFFLFSYLVIAKQGEGWGYAFCIDCWLKYCFFSCVDEKFEANQEVESSSCSTSSQTTRGGTTRTSMAGRTTGTSQNVDKKGQPTFQKFTTSKVHQIIECGHIQSNTCSQRMAYLLVVWCLLLPQWLQ
jgi:hypothetical protein